REDAGRSGPLVVPLEAAPLLDVDGTADRFALLARSGFTRARSIRIGSNRREACGRPRGGSGYPEPCAVAVAQLVDPRVVVPVVVGSSPIRHPSPPRRTPSGRRLTCDPRPRSSADRATDFESVCGGSTPPGAIADESPARFASHDDFRRLL